MDSPTLTVSPPTHKQPINGQPPLRKRPPITFEHLIGQWLVGRRKATTEVLRLGDLSHRHLAGQLKGTRDPGLRRRRRAELIRRIHDRLVELELRGESADVARYVACSRVAAIFGRDQARRLPLGVLRAFRPTIRRNPRTERWTLRPAHQEAIKQLWVRASTENLSAAAVTAQIDRILDRRQRPARNTGPVDRVIGLIASVSDIAGLNRIVLECEGRLRGLQRPSMSRAA